MLFLLDDLLQRITILVQTVHVFVMLVLVVTTRAGVTAHTPIINDQTLVLLEQNAAQSGRLHAIIHSVGQRLLDEQLERVLELLVAETVDQKVARAVKVDENNGDAVADRFYLESAHRVRIHGIFVRAEYDVG